MQVAFPGKRVEANKVLFKRFRLGGDLSRCCHREARTIKYKLVVSAHHVRVNLGQSEARSRCAEDRFALSPLSDVPGRRVDSDDEVCALLCEFFYRVAAVTTPLPILLIVPGVFANTQSNSSAVQCANALLVARKKIACLVEDVIGRQQHLVLPEEKLAALNHGGRILSSDPGICRSM